jgi:predicted nucleic acid-binding protein
MKIFVYTSAWFALNDRKDQNHERAVKFVKSFKSSPVLFMTTDYIVDETLTLLRLRISHRDALSFLHLVSHSQQIIKEQLTPEQLIRAEKIFSKYSDKFWSFIDCTSFAFMENKRLNEAFAFDLNF